MEVYYGVLSEEFSKKEPVFGHFAEWNTNNAKQVKYFKRVCIFLCLNLPIFTEMFSCALVVQW